MYRALLIVIISFLNFYTYSQNIQCISGNCLDGFGVGKFQDGTLYEGYFTNNLPHGKGIIKKDSKIIFTGEFANGQRNGFGTEYASNGEIYSGNWKNNIKSGDGTLFFPDSSFISASWLNNVPQGVSSTSYGCISGDCCTGTGKYKWVNGNIYEGQWRGSWRHGKGKIIFANGNMYEGNWNNDTISGFGTMQYANGDVYEGSWHKNSFNGLGTFTSADGKKQTDIWLNGKPTNAVIAFANDTCLKGNCTNGTGELFYRSNSIRYGAVYTGELKKAKPEGIGEMKYPYQYNQRGFYVNGEFMMSDTLKNACQTGNCNSGFGEYTWVSGEKYTGFWLNDKRNGWGYNYFDTGNEYEGTWRNNLKHGVGMHSFVNGEKYIGPFRNDFRDGFGTFYFTDGKKFTGQFKRDTIEGEGSMYYSDGSIRNGIWKQHKLIAATDGYFGCVTGNCFEGNGLYVSSAGWQYSGEWFQSNFHGFGRYTDEYGNFFEGMFKNNQKNGFGFELKSNGDSYLGSWKDNMYDGYGVLIHHTDTLKGLFRKNNFIAETPANQTAPEIIWINPIGTPYVSPEKKVHLSFGIRSSVPLHNVQLYVNHKLVYNQMLVNYSRKSVYGFDYIIECEALVKESNNLIQAHAINDYGKTESEMIQIQTVANPTLQNTAWIFQTSDVPFEKQAELTNWFESLNYKVNIINQPDRASLALVLRQAIKQQQQCSGKVLLYFAGTVFYLDSVNYFIPNLSLIQKSCDISVEGISLNQIISDFRHAGTDTLGIIIDQAPQPYQSVNYRAEHNYLLAPPPHFKGVFYLMSSMPFSYAGKYMHNYLFRNTLLGMQAKQKNKLPYILGEIKKASSSHQLPYSTFPDSVFESFFQK